jgi:hypothetical protein
LEYFFREHWRQIPPLEHQLPNRLWHCSILMGNEAILIYGGMNESPSSDSPFVRTLLVKPIRPPTLRQLALNSLTEQIIGQWREEMAASRNTLKSVGKKWNTPNFIFDFFLINQKPVLDPTNLLPNYRSHREASVIYNFSWFGQN